MTKHRGCLAAIAAVFLGCLTATAGLPILAFGSGGSGSVAGGCPPGPLRASDGTPTILGPSTLTNAEIASWWESTRRSQPPRLAMPVTDLIDTYLHEGDTKAVRGDIALAQAIHETGWFTSNDTSRHNYAGIAHADGAPSGQAFADPRTGVRAHIQLLKKFADGNDTRFDHPDVAPDAAATARTWGQLAGTWASSPDYWQQVSAVFDTMLTHAGREVMADPPADPHTCAAPPSPGAGVPDGQLTEVHGIVVHTSIAANVDALLTAARADGVHLTGWGYRSHDRQVELRRAHCGTSHHAIYEMPANQCSPPTARPGTSMHEQGLAIDFDRCSTRSTRCYQWLATNAAQHGLYNLPSEPWHWSVDGS